MSKYSMTLLGFSRIAFNSKSYVNNINLAEVIFWYIGINHCIV